MIDNTFSPSVVLAAVARELGLEAESLAVVDSPDGQFRGYYDVRSVPAGDLQVSVYRDKASAEGSYRSIIAGWLANGRYFDEMESSRVMLDAVARSCNLDDLRPWLTVAVREGWVRGPSLACGPSLAFKHQIDAPRTIESIKETESRLLEGFFQDPLAAVLTLLRGNLEGAISTLIEQCSFDTAILTDAIVKAEGGWEVFTRGMVAVTSEGFLVEAVNEHAVQIMNTLYDSQG